ncbi:MAG: hypothetical protein K940chlam7_01259 [Chlamydiae bacterium]|nr:hypothetical protein [Chlamydiota bacterium]
MKINKRFFSFPPYISTSWDNITALRIKEGTLIVHLVDGETVHIPNLESETLETIFDVHTSILEEKEKTEPSKQQVQGEFPFQQFLGGSENSENMDLPFRFGISSTDGFGAALQHNQAQADSPDLPPEVLDKIQSIAKIISPEDPKAIPKPEPHCNCIHCQIARAINQGLGFTDLYQKEERSEEAVSVEELQFQQWEISQTDEKLYTVSNRLDSKEKYNVFLGHPVGCTCGKEGCEHILAVLKS